MKTLPTDLASTGSFYRLPMNINDKINVKRALSEHGITWRSFQFCYGYRHKTGISYAINGIISGDISYINRTQY